MANITSEILGPDFTGLSDSRLQAMQGAADEMIEVLQQAASEGKHILLDVLASAGGEPFTEWEHYPAGDVHDKKNGALWFYHAHSENEAARPWSEHGHFHTFIYTEHLPDGAEPIALPDDPDFEKGGLCHLVSISFDHAGTPVRVFTTNRWVTSEWMYPAETLIPLIDRFRIEDGDYRLTSKWLMAAMGVFRPQIEQALLERDRVIGRMRQGDPEKFSEDKDVEVLSSFTFDLASQIDAIEAALEKA